MSGDNFVKWLSELSKTDINIAGSKGANLGEIYNANFPVPQAFVITTDAFYYFLNKTKIINIIEEELSKINVDNTEELHEKTKKIRDLIMSTKIPEELEKVILEAYEHFNIDLEDIKDSPGALAILRSAREPVFVSVRSSAIAEDLKDASFAGQQESFINVKGNSELINKVKRVFASIFTARSIYYRKKRGFEQLVGIAVVVQKMIDSDKSGVMFSKHPVSGEDTILIESVWGLGEGIVSGQIIPDQHIINNDLEILKEVISDKKIAITRTASGQTKSAILPDDKSKSRVLKTYEIKQLAEFALKLESHYKKSQDIEFAIENDTIYILQTRIITVLDNKENTQEIDGQLITEGMAASPGVTSGIIKIVKDISDLSKIKNGDVLVTTRVSPDMLMFMQKVSAVIISEGGITTHAAIVLREMGIPAVVGVQNALDVLEESMEVTIDGFNGKVFKGIAQNKSVEISPIVKTETKIKVTVDLPRFAQRAAETKADGIGLVRLEELIASNQKHPLAYKQENNLEGYKDMLKEGLKQIAEQFIGKPIWVRTSDIRSDKHSNLQGAPKEVERNPMLGLHGIRFSLRHIDILKAELMAIKELADLGYKFGVMLPHIISIKETIDAKKIFENIGCKEKVEFGVMIETPASAVLIKDICEVGIDFVSFGVEDLTQYTLAIDRGNNEVQYIYDENNWAVLKQISRVIRECQKYKVKTSICGQLDNNPKMLEFLIKCGIDSISVNIDTAYSVSLLVKELEENLQKDLKS